MTIQEGATVQISYEAVYVSDSAWIAGSDPPGHLVRAGEWVVAVPPTATVTVVQDPMPAEPADGSVVRVGAQFFTRSGSVWTCVNDSSDYSWADICALGTPVLMTPAP